MVRHAYSGDFVNRRAHPPIVTRLLATTQVYLSRVGAHEAVEAMRNREWNSGGHA